MTRKINKIQGPEVHQLEEHTQVLDSDINFFASFPSYRKHLMPAEVER